MIIDLIKKNNILWSEHAYNKVLSELIDPDIVFSTLSTFEILEEYPFHERGACFLALHFFKGVPLHVVWGISKGTKEPAIVVTIYRPKESKWLNLRKRKRQL